MDVGQRLTAIRRRARRRHGAVGAVAVAAGLLAFAPVFAASPAVSRTATATQPATRSATQIQLYPPPPPSAATTATYRITINITFSGSTHPNTAPSGAHVSNPILASHSNAGAMFVNGGFASAGVESMAELGRTATLVGELNGTPGVTRVQTTGGVAGIGTRVVTFDLAQSADLLSMVTMLAPSPDWFIGFADRDMFVNGAWVETVSFPLGNYDAGTGSGTQFAGGPDTQPRQTIGGPRDAVFINAASENPFGNVTITKIG